MKEYFAILGGTILTYDHVSVVTLVGDERVVGDGVEHDPAKLGMFWDWAGHGCNIFIL